jgi:tRNA U34 2-thiouridine synthase MnmA/TrmU
MLTTRGQHMSTTSELHQQIVELAYDLGDEAGHEWATVIAIADELNVPMYLVETVLDYCDSEFDDFDYEYSEDKEFEYA